MRFNFSIVYSRMRCEYTKFIILPANVDPTTFSWAKYGHPMQNCQLWTAANINKSGNVVESSNVYGVRHLTIRLPLGFNPNTPDNISWNYNLDNRRWTITPSVDKLIDFDHTDFNYGGSGRMRKQSIKRARTRKVKRTRTRRNQKSRSRK
jgi:hypothetical protein